MERREPGRGLRAAPGGAPAGGGRREGTGTRPGAAHRGSFAVPPALGGLLLGIAVGGAALMLPEARRNDFLAALLAVASGVYVGFASASPARERRIQWAAALAFTGSGLAGAWLWPPLLAAAWIAHAAWDLWHHVADRPVRTLAGYPMLCLVFDLVVAGFVLVHASIVG